MSLRSTKRLRLPSFPMSFATPLLLLCLLALPALGLWYADRQRARRRGLAAFAAPRMAASVTPNLPGWRRHAPMAVFVFALAALVLAAARPRLTVSRTVAHLQTMLALDMSGSMQAHDVAPSRAGAAQHAADLFVGGVPAEVAVGVMQFNQAPQVLALPTRNHRAAIEALGRLHIGGGTAIGSAVEEALAILRPTADPGETDSAQGAPTGAGGGTTPGSNTGPGTAPGSNTGPGTTPGSNTGSGTAPGSPTAPGTADPQGAAAAIVLLSDGGSTSGDDPLAAARAAARLRIPIFTVALGTANGTISVRHSDGRGTATIRVPVQTHTLAQVAQLSGGRAYTAADAGHLSAIYRQLSARLSHRSERRDLTPYLLGAGLGLLLLGSALSINWFGRLV
jgi:Ca-activated chloride channel family protein